VTAERLGVPAFSVMTTRFASAAELMSTVLGLPDYPFVTVEHPISSAGEARLAALAGVALEQGRRLLLRG
jgi:hypothetical protein